MPRCVAPRPGRLRHGVRALGLGAALAVAGVVPWAQTARAAGDGAFGPPPAVPEPSGAARAPQGQGQGPTRVVLVGDSIMLGAAPQIDASLRAAGDDVVVDAVESRSTLAGATALAGHLAAPADAVVVMLGANDAGDPETYRARVQAVVDAAGNVPHLFWMTIPEVRSYYPAANQVVREVAASRPGMVVMPWHEVTAANPSLTSGDGLHLKPSGSDAMAFFVTANLAAGLSPAAAPDTPSAGAPAPAAPAGASSVTTLHAGALPREAAAPAGPPTAEAAEDDGGGPSTWWLVGGGFGLVVAGLALVGLGLAGWSLWKARGRATEGRS